MSEKIKNIRFALVAVLLFFCAAVQAQTISGNVKDSNGEAIIGATIMESGTQNGTVTDFDGNFTLKLQKGGQLNVSYVGMKSKTVATKGKSSVAIVLEDDNTTLNDLVVVGYGSVKKKDLTGSVVTVSSKDITAVPVSNATEALTGKMAGVQVTTTEGSPDADVKIRVRGGGSITQSNDPLYIVDGFPVESISDIAPSDIEDMTVLKDASSTAIYGSRGANGVILITTKNGKAGKVSVTYNTYYAWKKVANSLSVLSPYDYANWQYELAMLQNKSNNYTDHFGSFADMDMYKGIATNDWQDITYGRTGHTWNNNLSITGGSEDLKYAFNYARVDDKAIMQTSEYSRDNLSLKVNHKIGKKVTLDYTVRFSKTKILGGGANDQTSSYNTDKRLRYAVQYTPFPVKGISGSDEDTDAGSNFYSPITSLNDNYAEKDRTQTNLGFAFTWNIIKNLKFKSEFGYDIYRNDGKRYYGLSTYYVQNVPSGDNQGKPAIELTKENRRKFRTTNTLNYDFKDVFGKNSLHHLNLLLGQEYINQRQDILTNVAHGFPENFSAQDCWNLTTQGTPYDITNYVYPDDNLASFFARANYDFDSKYLLSATIRADGSSKFSKGNQWGYFPSASFAWRISSEKFMKGAEKWLDDLKLRISYGTAGNNNIPSGVSLSQDYEAKATTWINGITSYWAPSKTMSNPNLTWETTITRNLGLDFTLFGSKLTGSIDYYWNSTKDLLIQFPVAGTGYDYQYRNMGETKNNGFEFSATWNAINKKNFGLSINGNISLNKNEVVSLGGMKSINNISSGWASSEIDQDFVIEVGQPIGQIYGYVSDGRYEVSDFDIDASKAQGKWVLKDGVANNVINGVTVQPGMMKIASQTQHWDAAQGAWVWNENNETLLDGKTADGKISTSDRRIIGDTNPKATGGFNFNVRLYDFDFAANFTYSIGNDVYNANKLEYTQTSKYNYRNLSSDMAQGIRWTSINAAGELLNWNNAEELAALNANTTMWSPYTSKYILTDYGVEDGSFLRLATLTLGYTVPKNIIKKLGLSNVRVYGTCYNVFCITNYSGYDPEVSAIRKTNMTPGVDYSAYPKSRQYVLGLSVNF